jgi:hypothetical protein
MKRTPRETLPFDRNLHGFKSLRLTLSAAGAGAGVGIMKSRIFTLLLPFLYEHSTPERSDFFTSCRSCAVIQYCVAERSPALWLENKDLVIDSDELEAAWLLSTYFALFLSSQFPLGRHNTLGSCRNARQ